MMLSWGDSNSDPGSAPSILRVTCLVKYNCKLFGESGRLGYCVIWYSSSLKKRLIHSKVHLESRDWKCDFAANWALLFGSAVELSLQNWFLTKLPFALTQLATCFCVHQTLICINSKPCSLFYSSQVLEEVRRERKKQRKKIEEWKEREEKNIKQGWRMAKCRVYKYWRGWRRKTKRIRKEENEGKMKAWGGWRSVAMEVVILTKITVFDFGIL